VADNQEAAIIDQNEFDEIMMRRALDLAARSAGSVSPNPMVGAVIVGPDRMVIGEGWHERYGGPHAEINALRSVEGKDLTDATLYVTLEPCSHFGKTPPCAEAIAATAIKRVVVATRDPNPLVSGQGNRRLREAGIEVVVGTLEREARRLNEAYIHYITSGMPFVAIKMAQTLDGFTALPSGESRWITGEYSRRRVHELRAVYDAVMVGTRTALVDDPSLTLRYGVEGRNPKRVVLDRQLTLPSDLRIFSDEHRHLTIVITAESLIDSPRASELRDSGVQVFGAPVTPRGLKLPEVLRILGENGVASLLVEGGAGLAGAYIKEGLAQKLILFLAPKLFGHGMPAFAGLEVQRLDEAYAVNIQEVEVVGEDLMVVAYW
jgi:diaminohydroxyphosphoribosylaminopyrimidine deaminase / 5-amino-6-(5-phosphoribosylamino)uracil reductase